MRVSVITVCRNNADTIEATIRSVLEQDYPDIEYIIRDGCSTDGTMEKIAPFRDRIAVLDQGKDGGVYFALNKAFERATGDIIALIHGDDFYVDKTVIRKVVETFERTGVDCVYGDLQYVDRIDTSKIKRHWKSGPYHYGLFCKGWMPPHPAFFAKRSCYEKYGSFDTSFRTAADYELMLRFLHRYELSVAYLPEVLVKMRTGGVSNASLKNRINANREDRRAWKVNGLKPGMFTLIRKPLSKIGQFLGMR